MSSKDISRRLAEMKQYQAKVPKNVISNLSEEIYGILGGIHAILEHYVSNARYLKVHQVNQLHELLKKHKNQTLQRKIQKKRKRTSGSAALLQSSTNLCNNSSDDGPHNNNHKATASNSNKRQPRMRNRAATNMKPRKHLHQTEAQTETDLSTPSFASNSRSKSSQPHARNRKQKEETQSTNNMLSLSASKSFEPQKQHDASPVHEYKPLFATKTAQVAQMRHNKREHKRRGSGLADRLNMERGKLTNNNNKASLSTNTLLKDHNDGKRYKQNARKYTQRTPTQKRKSTTLRHPTQMHEEHNKTSHDTQRTMIVHHRLQAEKDEFVVLNVENDAENHRDDHESEEMISSKTKYDKNDKRRYSISEFTDWCADNNETEVQQTNDYFRKLQKQYAKKKGKKKKKKKKKGKKKKEKMMRLKRLALQQMQSERLQEPQNPEDKKRIMSAMDALNSVMKDRSDESGAEDKENVDKNSIEMEIDEKEGDPMEETQMNEGYNYDGDSDVDNGDNISYGSNAKHGDHIDHDDENAGHATYLDSDYNNNGNDEQWIDPSGKGIDSPEFLAYFDKFMKKNCSFYITPKETMMNSDMGDESDISSMDGMGSETNDEDYAY